MENPLCEAGFFLFNVMIMRILEVRNRFANLDTDKICISAVERTKDTIADLNAEQMFKGLRSDGSEITPDYSDVTIAIKEEKGQPTDRVTLRDKGDFQNELYADIQGDKLIINSRDEKAAALDKKYSKAKGSIYGLSGPFKREYLNEKLRPEFKKLMQNATGLKFSR